jgi:membrane protein
MPRATSHTHVWKLGGLTWKELLRRTWHRFWKDRVLDQSAMLSFYFLLSIFPLLLFLMALLGLLLQSGPALQETLHQYLLAVVPRSASTLIDTTLDEITRGSGPVTLSVALLFAWWPASQGMRAIVEGLNLAYEGEESRPWWKQYLIASGLTIASLVFFGCALLLLIYGERLSEIIAMHLGYSGFIARLWQVVSWLLLLVFVLTAFNILYIYAPNVKHRQWDWLKPGTIVGVALWLLASFGFKLYLGFFDRFSVTYGSIGAVIILLLWLYLSGIAILVGGEVNSEIEKAAGGRTSTGACKYDQAR